MDHHGTNSIIFEIPLYTRTYNGIRYRNVFVANALVDLDDKELICKYTWRPHISGYAAANPYKGSTILMHRLVTGCYDSEKHVHHVNGNKLDNRRSNLVILDVAEHHRQDNRQTRTVTGIKTKYAGVTRNKATGKWRAFVYHNNKQIYIGAYGSDIEAAKAYNEYVKANSLPHKLNDI